MSEAFTPRPRWPDHNLFWLAAIFVAFSVFSIQSFGAQLSLSWDASPTASVTGYKVYYGQASGNYTNSSDVGNRLSYTIGGLTSNQNYYFAVTAYDATGAQSAFSNEVSGTAPAATTADFTASPTSGTAPLAVTFVNRSAGATSYSWNFGDSGSTNNTSTATNPTHTYNSAGAYTVTLNATGADGTRTKTLTSYITVSAPATTTNTTAPTSTTSASTTATTPIANPDRYTVQTGTTLNVAAPGVLSNDTGAPGKSLTAKGVASVDPGTGSLRFYSSGRFKFIPASGFVGTTTFTYTANDGTTTSSPATVTINVTAAPAATSTTTPPAPATSTTIWPPTAAPANLDRDDSTPVNLGVRFTSSQDGYITGIRFYKSLANTGTHIGGLWTSNGTNLANARFTNETASGWQQADFATPVPIKANTVYVASYFAPNGHFSFDDNYFANAGFTSGPLTALRNDATNRNGVYAYGSGPVFPAFGYYPRNYWVDVVFKPES